MNQLYIDGFYKLSYFQGPHQLCIWFIQEFKMSYILLNIFYTICTPSFSFERNCVHQTMEKFFKYFEKKVEINVNGGRIEVNSI